jgi:hypothetical protein
MSHWTFCPGQVGQAFKIAAQVLCLANGLRVKKEKKRKKKVRLLISLHFF